MTSPPADVAATGAAAPAQAAEPLEAHLSELRRRAIICICAVVVLSGAGWYWAPQAITWVRGDTPLLIFVTPAEAFMTYLRVAASLGIGLAMPVILWEAWRFVAPALFPHERRRVRLLAPLAVLMYAAGLALGVMGVFPLSLHLFFGLAPAAAEPAISISRLWGFFLSTTLPLGFIFQLPLALAVLLGLRVLTLDQLRIWRRGALLISVIVAGMLAPSVPAQLMMAAALMVMYELGSGLAALLRLGAYSKR